MELLRDESRPYGEFIQPVGAKLAYGVEWSDRLIRYWAPATLFDVGVAIRSRRSPGFNFMSCGGVSGATEPLFPGAAGNPTPAQVGQCVIDGSIMWVAHAVDDSSYITTVRQTRWEADAGIAVLATGQGTTEALAVIDSSSATDGQDYYLRNFSTMTDDSVEVAIFLIHVRSRAA